MNTTRTPPRPIPLTLLTGFLGSGKTTLLNDMLTDPSLSDTVVIINEFGEIGLDHLLVETADEGMIEMSSGCLCCTIRGDLITTLETLLRKRDNHRIRPFARVIIESTGLADPAPILHTVMAHPYLVLRYRLDGVVTTVDAVNGMATLASHEEAVKQVAVADRIVLTKTDLLDGSEAAAALKLQLHTINPSAPLLERARDEATAIRMLDAGLYNPQDKSADVARWLRDEALKTGKDHHHAHSHDPNRHDHQIRAFCLTRTEPVAETGFNLFLELLRARHGPDLLRVKGIICLAEDPERPVVIHGVQHVFHPPARLPEWPGDDRRTRLVFITRAIGEAQIAPLLDAFTNPVSEASARIAAEQDNPLALGPGRGLLKD